MVSNKHKTKNGGTIMKNFKDVNEIKNFINNASIAEVACFLNRFPEYMKYAEGKRRKDIIMMTIFTSPVVIGCRFTKEDLCDPDIAMALVLSNPYSIKDVCQTEEICLSAVRRNGRVLEFIHSKTRAVCMEAIIQSPWALEFVPVNAPFYTEIAELAIRLEPDTIRLVDPTDQTENMRRAALINTRNIEYVCLTDEELEKYSSGLIVQDPDLVWMFPEKIIEAVNADGTILAAIHPDMRTEEVCRTAVFSWDLDNIIPFIPMQYRDKIVNELISRIKAASELDESQKYYGFCAPYGIDEYDEDDDSCDDENTVEE